MVTILLIFLLTAGISFAGSLQLGPVNYFVMETCLRENRTSGIMVAIGGCIPEFIYSFLAIFIGMSLQEMPTLFLIFQWTTIAVLLVLSIYYFFKKNTENSFRTSGKKASLLKGFSLGMLNPQLLPFWLVVYTSFFTKTGLTIHHIGEQVAFILGTGIGAFALHLFLVFLVHTNRQKLEKFIRFKHFNTILSGLFFVLALVQLIALC